jgi:Holliday junction resolvase RusA-like endonuclease
VLKQYRRALWEAWKAAGHVDTISTPVDLSVTFINPTGPDLDNLLTALFQALDGKTGNGPTLLADDRLISYVRMGLLRS